MSTPCPTFGFVVSIALRADCAPTAPRSVRDAFDEFLAVRGLVCAGRVGAETALVVTSEASQPTDLDRSAVERWLAAQSTVAAWRVGELVDVGDGC